MNQVYEYVTNRILEQLEKGVIPWKKPWTNGMAINYVTRKPYRGINTILLDKGGEYLSFKQIQALGGCIKKGAKANMVVFYKVTTKKTDETEEIEDNKIKKYFLLRYYNVFHISDVEGINSKIQTIENNPIEVAENIVNNYLTAPKMVHKDNTRAYYSPSSDYINTPELNCYPEVEEYYSVLFHEMIHSTGHTTRLNRDGVTNAAASFGSTVYSKEELVAELGSAMLCGVAGIENITIQNSASYIKSWLEVLKNDKTLVIKASAFAQKACDYILGNQFEGLEE